MPKIDPKDKKDRKCFECGTTKTWINKSTGTEAWRKRKINGRWDGKNYLCDKCGHKLDYDRLDREKIIILSMIAARTFSEKSPVDLRKDEITRDEWKDIIEKSYEKLKELNLIGLDRNRLYDESGVEHPVGNLFRVNTRNLKKSTKGLFKYYSSNMTYFLDIFRESEISKDNINYLLKLIIGKKILNDPAEIYNFCLDISNNKHIFLFDPKEHVFSKPKFDEIMKDIMLYSYSLYGQEI